MGKAGRFACIFTPMVLTIGALVCLVLVGLGGTNKNNDFYNDFYFFRANTSDITVSPSDLGNLPSNPLTDSIVNETTSAVASALGIYDFYHISLWNYCAGNFTSSESKNSSATPSQVDNVTYCSPHTNAFWFNPVEVWNLNNTGVDHFFSKELKAGLNTYHTVSKWMFIAYVVALISTIVEILVGFLALFSRLGSLATTIVSTISSLFILAFALTSTILYGTLAGSFNTALNKYNVHGSLGHNIYVITWLGTAFSLGAGFFWLLSSCCCSGRSDRIKGYTDESANVAGSGKKGSKFGKGGWGKPYQYNRVESPVRGGLSYGEPTHGYPTHSPQPSVGGYGHPQAGPQGGTEYGRVGRVESYEPFRHV